MYIRNLGILFLLCLLVGLFVWAGTIQPDPSTNTYPGSEELITNYDAYVEQHVQIGGTVVTVDPVVIKISNGIETDEMTVTNVDKPVSQGDSLRVFGTAQPGHTIKAQQTIVYEPWEQWYMYTMSFLASLWVLERIVIGWRLVRIERGFVPRETEFTVNFSGEADDA